MSPKVTERASSWRKGYAHSEGHRLLLKRYDRCVKASTLASLPSQALRASSPKGRAFAEEEKPRGISKASPFGRGVTEGDGEGKPVTKRLLTQRWAGSLSERCHRNVAASLSASLPSQALRASSPKGRAFAEEAKLHGISKASPFGRGVTEGDGEGKPVTKRLLTQRWAGSLSERCHRNVAASLSASLPSQALRASSPKGRALGEEAKPRGISKASPFGRGVTEGDGEGKPVTKRLLTQRWAGSLSERCHRNVAASLSASLPSQALRASSPKGRAFRDGL